MDNSQFRNLLQTDKSVGAQDDAAPRATFRKPALGSRSRASVPMTPRSLAGQNASRLFAQQVTDSRKDHDGPPPTKKFKTSAPKGTKLGSGYQDRTLSRKQGEEETQDDKEKRLKALEEMFKLQQIDEATFEKLKSEIGIGGDLSSTHLVKGLDWKLLNRVRRGEDLNASRLAEEKNEATSKMDVDEELDQALEKEVQATSHASKKEQDETTTELEQPTTRDEILRRLKESRAAKQEPPPEPVLGDRFKKVVSDKPGKKKFVEVVNGRRREVLVITNKDGTTKRKTRWIDKEEDVVQSEQSQPLGMEVPAEFQAKQQALLNQQEAEDEDDDIFQGVADYDPLAGINSASEDEAEAEANTAVRAEKKVTLPDNKPRNYFGSSNQDQESEDRTNPILKDPTLLSALKRAAGLRASEEAGKGEVGMDPARNTKEQQLLARLRERDQADAADMDMGFGESRFGDEEDDDRPVWDDGDGSTKKSGRKRGPKKRKGDKDNVSDVMAALQGRKDKS